MSQSVVIVTEAPVSLPVSLRAGVEAAFAFAQQKRAASTRGGYEADFRLFEAWCGDHGRCRII